MYNVAHHPVVLFGFAVIVFIALLIVVSLATRRRTPKLDIKKFQDRWKEVQQLCGTNTTWPLAVVNADKLLDEALKRTRTKGKTMGERLVAAQRRFSDNDSVWFGHKLRNRIVHEDVSKLRQRDVQAALRGFREALKDLGAFE